MKNLLNLALLSLVLISGACKKEEINSNKPAPDADINLLVSKYNLNKVSVDSAKYTKKFKDITEFRLFLENREALLSTTSQKQVYTTLITDTIPQLKTFESGFVGDTPGYPTTTKHYVAHITSTYWGAQGFPSYVVFLWDWDYGTNIVSNIDTQLYEPGSNVGTFGFFKTAASGTQNYLRRDYQLTGIYAETYSVGDIYTYTKLYDYSFNGQYNGSTRGFTCTMQYLSH
jgi:hypothetical protein